MFIPHYIISYETLDLLESEKDCISLIKIEDYIKFRNCDINKDEIQNLIYQDKKIGQLIILNNNIIFIEKSFLSKKINPNKIINIPKKPNKLLIKINNNTKNILDIYKKENYHTKNNTNNISHEEDSFHVIITNPKEKQTSKVILKRNPKNLHNQNINNRNKICLKSRRFENNENYHTKSQQINLNKDFLNILDKNENNKKEL